MKERIEICKCDRCKAIIEKPVSFAVHTDYQAGAVEQERVIERLDLCAHCASVVMQRTINIFVKEFPQAKQLVLMAKDMSPLLRREQPF